MPQTGNSFCVSLTPSQLGWDEERYTDSRPTRKGEAYLAIRKEYAQAFQLFNSNQTNGYDILGQNIFNCISDDGYLNCQLKSEGCSSAGDIYAKQFAGNNNLRALGDWYSYIGAREGDEIEVYFLSPTDIRLRLI